MKALSTILSAVVMAIAAHPQPSLELNVPPASLFVRPGEEVLVLLDVFDLPVKVNACQAFLGYSSTYFFDPGPAGCVTAGGGVWDLVIWDSWRDSGGLPGEIDTAVGLDAQGAVGTDADATVARIRLTAGSVEGITRLIFRPDPVPDPGLVRSTYFADLSAQPVWPIKQNSPRIIIDGTPPDLVVVSALQGAADVLDGAAAVVPGVVTITIAATDPLAGLVGPPTVVVVDGVQVEVLTTADTTSPFRYSWVVTTGTENGRWNLNVSATDHAGNTASDVGHYFTVNKNQISGQVELEAFVGTGTVPSHTRAVTFVATGGTITKTWTVTLSNTSGPIFHYLLTDVPAGTTALSAKTNWNLRRRQPMVLDGLGQATVNFTGATRLAAGDLNGDNVVQLLDYSVLRSKWFTTDPAADFNGDGQVQLLDYSLLRANWFTGGDPP
ncbi:MAG: hypothetical protein IPM17_07350 [Verrucomicrobia bacterium]|nr:hypothetical protein [Verrucomicrobiota bacterium]